MVKIEWLQQIESELPEILNVAKKCDEPYRQKCFELLFQHALNTSVTQPHSVKISDTTKKDVNDPIKIVKPPDVKSKKYEKFLSDFKIEQTLIDNLIDTNSGEIISSNLGKKGSDITRNVAVLLAIIHLYKDGEFSFTTEELKNKSKVYGVPYHNQKRDIKSLTFESKKVFIENNDNWIIPVQLQSYIANVIKELNNIQ